MKIANTQNNFRGHLSIIKASAAAGINFAGHVLSWRVPL